MWVRSTTGPQPPFSCPFGSQTLASTPRATQDWCDLRLVTIRRQAALQQDIEVQRDIRKQNHDNQLPLETSRRLQRLRYFEQTPVRRQRGLCGAKWRAGPLSHKIPIVSTSSGAHQEQVGAKNDSSGLIQIVRTPLGCALVACETCLLFEAHTFAGLHRGLSGSTGLCVASSFERGQVKAPQAVLRRRSSGSGCRNFCQSCQS